MCDYNLFDLLVALQAELTFVLESRKEVTGYIPPSCSRERVRRLRLEIAAVMLRIERDCITGYKNRKEHWE